MLEKFFKTRPSFSVKDDLNTKASKRFAPNTKIAYNPNLISVLEREHRELADLFEKASMTAYAGMQKKSRVFFLEFKDRFIDNVLRQIFLCIFTYNMQRNPAKIARRLEKLKRRWI